MEDFFDKKFLEDSQEEIKQREAEYGNDKREKMTPGAHTMTICKIETETDKNNVPIVRIVMNKDLDQKSFRDLFKIFYFDSKNQEKIAMNKKMFIEFFYKAFEYTFKPVDLQGAVAQARQFEGKKLNVAVQIRQKLYKKYVKDEERKNTDELHGIMVIDNAQVWYVGKATEQMTFKPEKKFLKLTEKELEEYEDHKKEFPDKYDETGRLVFKKKEEGKKETSASQGDPNPWPEEKPKVNEPKEKAAENKKPEPKAEANDALPWE